MTALELNAEIYRAMGEIAEDENLLAKVLKYVKGLAPAKNKKVEADGQHDLLVPGRMIVLQMKS